MHPSQMTGLQLLQAMSRGDLPRASISETIPMTMEAIDAGTCLLYTSDAADDANVV